MGSVHIRIHSNGNPHLKHLEQECSSAMMQVFQKILIGTFAGVLEQGKPILCPSDIVELQLPSSLMGSPKKNLEGTTLVTSAQESDLI